MKHRYTARFRRTDGMGPDDYLPRSIFGDDDELGTWDTVRECFVKRVNGDWVPEAAEAK